MAHFAQLESATNTVLRVIVISNEAITDETGQEHESLGIALCQQLYGADTAWVQTSYNSQFRRYYAGVGFGYDAAKDVFILPKPSGDGWILDPDTLEWVRA
jgi:hypothetical protein